MSSADDFGTLVELTKAGDEEASRSLGKRLGGVLQSRLQSGRGMNRDDAESLALDCVGTIMIKLDTYTNRPGGSFLAWCYKIADNGYASWYRSWKRKSDGRLTLSLDDVPEPTAPQTTDDKDAPLLQAVRRVLSQLSDGDQEILILRNLQPENSSAEISEFLGISEVAERARYKRARDRAAALLADEPRVRDWLGSRPVLK